MPQPSVSDYVAADRAAFVNQIAEWLREGFEEDVTPREVQERAAQKKAG